MDVHPTKKGINRYWSIAICISAIWTIFPWKLSTRSWQVACHLIRSRGFGACLVTKTRGPPAQDPTDHGHHGISGKIFTGKPWVFTKHGGFLVNFPIFTNPMSTWSFFPPFYDRIIWDQNTVPRSKSRGLVWLAASCTLQIWTGNGRHPMCTLW